jgi:D-inositol-3-phosphate glycosyltransferase
MISYHTCPLATLGGKSTGGMNVYVRDLTRHLGKYGVHVDVFTRSQDEHVPHVLHDLGYGNRIVHVPSGPETNLSKEDMSNYIPEFVDWIVDFTARKGLKYDLIHSHYWMSGIAAKALKAAWDIPVIHMFHTLSLVKNQIARDASEIEGSYRIDGEKEVLQTADRIVIATPAEKSQLESLYHANTNNLVVIPPGVDVSYFYPIQKDEAKEVIGIPENDRMILFVGRIEPLKGIDTLIRAIHHIEDNAIIGKCPHYLTVIGGDPDLCEEDMNSEMVRLQKLREELGLDDLVVFIGKRDQDALPYYYSAAEVVVVPSHYESFGMVALESMACGTPVIASQVGGLAFLVQDGLTGYFVPNNDPAALGEKITEMLCNIELREKMGKNAIQLAYKYRWEKISQMVIDLYKNTIQSEKSAG